MSEFFDDVCHCLYCEADIILRLPVHFGSSDKPIFVPIKYSDLDFTSSRFFRPKNIMEPLKFRNSFLPYSVLPPKK